MAKCFATGKKTVFGNTVSHSHRSNGVIKRVYVSTSALKSGLVQRV